MSMQRVAGGIRVGNLFFYTGYPSEATGEWTVDRQIRAILEELKQDLKQVGSSLENVVKATVYLVNLDDRERYLNPVWKEYFPKAAPVRCTIQAWLAPPAMVEVEFIVYIPEK